MRKDPYAKMRKHRRDKYMYNPYYKEYGSMFFWFYSILCFSDFDFSLFIRDGVSLRKKFDSKVLLALELIKFSTTYNKWSDWGLKSPITYKNLVLIWWLIFDKQSEWNKELREILKWTGQEGILDLPTPASYDDFFKDYDSVWIDKISFSKFLWYLPKEMFVDAVALVLKCSKKEWTNPNELWDNEILWLTWGRCFARLNYAVSAFYKKPSQRRLIGKDKFIFLSPEEWLALFQWREQKKRYMEKLGWESGKFKYTRQYYKISNERWIATMEPILQKIADKKEEEKELVTEGITIKVHWVPVTKNVDKKSD